MDRQGSDESESSLSLEVVVQFANDSVDPVAAMDDEESLDLVESEIERRPGLLDLVVSFVDLPAALRELDGQSLVTIMSGEIRRRHQLVRLVLHCEKLRAAMEDEAAVAWLLLRVLDRDRGEAV